MLERQKIYFRIFRRFAMTWHVRGMKPIHVICDRAKLAAPEKALFRLILGAML
jgi:hypothetical protein